MSEPISINRERILELTADIVISAMQTGKLDAGNAQAVADFYSVVAGQVLEAAYIDLPEITARYLQKRK